MMQPAAAAAAAAAACGQPPFDDVMVTAPVRRLQTTTATAAAAAADEQITCAICFDVLKTATSLTGGLCQHSYCALCLRGYVLERLSRHQVDDMAMHCPECTLPGHPGVVAMILSADDTSLGVSAGEETSVVLSTTAAQDNPLLRWQRLRELQTCPDALECPQCGAVCRDKSRRSGLLRLVAAHNREVQCSECSLPTGLPYCFCAVHGDAHLGKSCAEFEAEQQAIVRLNESYIASARVHPCPKCASPIEKNGGCLHMTCRSCGHEFCWCCRHDWKLHVAVRGATGVKAAVGGAALVLLCPGSHLFGISPSVFGEDWGTKKIWASRAGIVVLVPVGGGIIIAAGTAALATVVAAAPFVFVGRKIKSTARFYYQEHAARKQRERLTQQNRLVEETLGSLATGYEQLYEAEHGVPPPQLTVEPAIALGALEPTTSDLLTQDAMQSPALKIIEDLAASTVTTQLADAKRRRDAEVEEQRAHGAACQLVEMWNAEHNA
jgi:hypothetical protein